jgi:flagellar protein FliO/FliZ
MTDHTSVMIAIGFMAILLILSILIRRRSHAIRRDDIHAVKILSTLALSAKEKILLLEVQDQKILVGVTANQISNLFSFDDKRADLAFEDVAQWQPASQLNMRTE